MVSHCAGSARRIGLVAVIVLALPSHPRAEPLPLPLDDFSPAFLGMYRKLMEIEPEIRRHAAHYGVDVDLARAVCLYESGGNAGLVSHAGAQGYFQVMPRTFRELNVATNIEAGVKYLAQMLRQFGREDRAVAAYNGGPGRIGRGGGVPLETLQYVVGVGHYRSVLKEHDASLRHHASQLRLRVVEDGDDWSTLSERLGVPLWEVRLHNTFLAGRPLRAGDRVAYPSASRGTLFVNTDGGWAYRIRHGDNYLSLAITLGLDLDGVREANGLWHTQTVTTGTVLRIPPTADRAHVIRTALMDQGTPPPWPRVDGADAPPVEQRPTLARTSPPSSGTQGSRASDQSRRAGATSAFPLNANRPAVDASTTVYTVRRGDTLHRLAQRHGTHIEAIRRANTLQGSVIREGQRLRIPIAGVPPRRQSGTDTPTPVG